MTAAVPSAVDDFVPAAVRLHVANVELTIEIMRIDQRGPLTGEEAPLRLALITALAAVQRAQSIEKADRERRQHLGDVSSH